MAVVLRLPQLLASRHLSFDDGVFGASAVAMRHGAAPFRDVFSSQGPLFLPLVWVFDALGGRTSTSPRLVALLSGVAVTLAVWSITRRIAGPGPAWAAALVATASGSLLWVTGPVAADGPGLAFATLAVALVLGYRDAPSTPRAVAVGAAIGAAFAVKSLFAVPPGLAVAWVLLESRRWHDLALAVSASAVVVLAAAVPWGLAEVWDQSVDYHLEAAGRRTPVANGRKVVSTLWDRDLLLLVAAIAGAGFALRARQRRAVFRPDLTTTAKPHPWGGPAAPVVAWLVGTVVVLLATYPMWRPHVSHLVAPVAVLAAVGARRHLALFAGVLAVAAAFHAASVAGIVWPGGYEGDGARAAERLRSLPEAALAISDDPGLVWRAGLRTPDDLVDTSFLRIDAGRITEESLLAEAARPDVCAVVQWESRRHFARFDLGDDLRRLGYVEPDPYPGFRAVFVRPACLDD